MKVKKQILKIKEIIIDEKLYPRLEYDENTSKRYSLAMESGADFPPIVVAIKNKKFYLVDGLHRLNAYKINKKEVIEVDVLEGLKDKDIFIEAVKRNIIHGRPFSEEDIEEIKITLEDFNLGIEEVSKIVRIPVGKLKPFVAKEIESNYDEDFSKMNEKQYDLSTFEEVPIDPSNLITTRIREMEKRLEEQKLVNKYTIENFICFIFSYSKRMEDFLSNLEKMENLESKHNSNEIKILLEKIDKSSIYLKKVKKILNGVLNKDFSEVNKLRENYKSKTEKLLKEEKDYFGEEEIKEFFEEHGEIAEDD
jgi:hypothetical protein